MRTMQLTLVERLGRGKATFRCTCGSVREYWLSNVRPGVTMSCGCYRPPKVVVEKPEPPPPEPVDAATERARLKYIWVEMRRRCTKPRNPSYPRYGGRGIAVCERWGKLENFLADMGVRPPGTSLERIDNDGPYSPDNCRWATRIVQANNKRNNNRLTLNGVTKTRAEWAREIGVTEGQIKMRQRKGLPIEQVLDPTPHMRGPKPQHTVRTA